MRKKKHAHQLSNTSAGVLTSDVRTMSASPTQLAPDEVSELAALALPGGPLELQGALKRLEKWRGWTSGAIRTSQRCLYLMLTTGFTRVHC